LYATGCGVIAALGFYHVTQPAAIRVAPGASERAVVWLTILGAFASPIFLPLTAALVDAMGWRDTLRVLAAIAATVFLATAASGRGSSRVEHCAVRRTTVPNALRGAWCVPGFRRWVLASRSPCVSGRRGTCLLMRPDDSWWRPSRCWLARRRSPRAARRRTVGFGARSFDSLCSRGGRAGRDA
jgi:hypothetical protein